MRVRQRVRKDGTTPKRRSKYWVLSRLATRKNIKGLLLLAGAIYILVSLVKWYFAVTYYGDVGVNDRRADVRYALGAPASGTDANPVWRYPTEAGSTLTVEFNSDNRIRRISCDSPTAEPGSCPLLYGAGIGDSERDIGHRLGAPDVVEIRGDKKYFAYNSLGATFVMQRFVVTGLVRARDTGGLLSKTGKFFRNLVILPGWIG